MPRVVSAVAGAGRGGRVGKVVARVVVGSGERRAGSPLERVGKAAAVLGGLGEVDELLTESVGDGVHGPVFMVFRGELN